MMNFFFSTLRTLPRKQLPRGRCFTTTTSTTKPPLCIVDLRGSGWSLLERLCLEEFLAHTKTQQNWLVLGTQEPTQHRHLKLRESAPSYVEQSIQQSASVDGGHYNPSCALVVNKESANLNTSLIQQDGILCVTSEEQSLAGESVVLDHSTLWTTLLMTEECSAESVTQQLWKPTFDRMEEWRLQTPSSRSSSPLTMVLDTKSCSKGDNSGRLVRLEDLGITSSEEEEEEAQSSSKALSLSFQAPNQLFLGDLPIGRIHANSSNSVTTLFWWDYDEDHFQYLNDNEPLWKLQDVYPSSNNKLLEVLQAVCREECFDVIQIMNPRDMVRFMAQEKTSLQDWWDRRSKWKIVQQF